MNSEKSGPKPARRKGGFWHAKPRNDGAAGSAQAAERNPDQLWIYGIHPVAAVLANPKRSVLRLLATRNAAARIEEEGSALPATFEETTPRDLDRLLGPDAVHQGAAVEVAALEPLSLDAIAEARLVIALDQVTDPHNVGAILRSAVAFGADAIITTNRHAPAETGVLAKAASGALEHITIVEVPNLARAMTEIGKMGFWRIGLDSEGTAPLETSLVGERIVLVLGSEGKGLRRLTRDLCDVVARLDMPGAIKSLNVSNAAALSLYMASRHINSQPR